MSTDSDEPRRGTCAEFVIARHREGTGPRGGRRTFVRLACARCRFESEEIATKRPGSYDEAMRTARASLLQRQCVNPRVDSDATKMLRECAKLIRNSEYPGLAFAVRWLPAGQSTTDAAVAAWRECDDGHAMAQYMAAAFGSTFGFGPNIVHDDGRASVSFVASGTRVTFHGLPDRVATLMRATVSDDSVRRIARRLERT